MTRTRSSAARLRAASAVGRQQVARGERPVYHVTWALAEVGAIDVRVTELPIIHLFVPDPASVFEGARVLIAQTLAVDPAAFDVIVGLRVPRSGRRR